MKFLIIFAAILFLVLVAAFIGTFIYIANDLKKNTPY